MGLETALAVGGLVLSAAGTAATVVGQQQAGQASANAARYQAQVADNNAILAQQKAQQETAAGEQRAANEALKTRAQVGAIKAAQGASGVDVNDGSAVDVRSSAAELGQLNALTTRANAENQAYGYQTAATSYEAQADLDRSRASSAISGANAGAWGSLLSGASSVGKQYAKWQQVGGSSTPSPGETAAVDDQLSYGYL